MACLHAVQVPMEWSYWLASCAVAGRCDPFVVGQLPGALINRWLAFLAKVNQHSNTKAVFLFYFNGLQRAKCVSLVTLCVVLVPR
jgi:hypothetical protein